MMRSTLLHLAHQAWQGEGKQRQIADTLAESELFSSGSIHAITGVLIQPGNNRAVVGSKDRLNPATLDILYLIACAAERGHDAHTLVAQAIANGTSRYTIERLTGYATDYLRGDRPRSH